MVYFHFQVLSLESLASLSFSSSSHSSTSLFVAAILSLFCCSIMRCADLCHVGTIVTPLAWMADRLGDTGSEQY